MYVRDFDAHAARRLLGKNFFLPHVVHRRMEIRRGEGDDTLVSAAYVKLPSFRQVTVYSFRATAAGIELGTWSAVESHRDCLYVDLSRLHETANDALRVADDECRDALSTRVDSLSEALNLDLYGPPDSDSGLTFSEDGD